MISSNLRMLNYAWYIQIAVFQNITISIYYLLHSNYDYKLWKFVKRYLSRKIVWFDEAQKVEPQILNSSILLKKSQKA